jgi:hypothetical protein
MQYILNPPNKIRIRINSDEQLTVFVQNMRFIDDENLEVAGFIDTEDSKIIKRAHLPRTIFLGCILYVTEFKEYDDKPDSVCIDCKFTLNRDNPSKPNA